jgi:hypothetical protein
MERTLFYIDGFSFRRINDFYRNESEIQQRLNLDALLPWVRHEVKSLGFAGDSSVECRFYSPACDPRLHFWEGQQATIRFEDRLCRAGFEVHYKEQSEGPLRPNLQQERDALEELFYGERIGLFVLFSTQKDYARLLRALSEQEVPQMLVGWEAQCHSKAGKPIYWRPDPELRKATRHYSHFEESVLAKRFHLLADAA